MNPASELFGEGRLRRILEESAGARQRGAARADPRGGAPLRRRRAAARRHDARGAQGRRGGAGRVTPEREALLAALAERLGHRFRDLALLDRALTHASQANEARTRGAPRQRAARVPGRLRAGPGRHGPAAPAGSRGRRGPQEPAARRARLGAEPGAQGRRARSARSCFGSARARRRPGGRAKTALWSDAYEAVIAAVYLDGGFEAAQRFVAAQFAADLEAPDGRERRREEPAAGAAAGPGTPAAAVRGRGARKGPSHRRRFRVECRLDDGTVTTGEGSTKKAAEQAAARAALAKRSRSGLAARRFAMSSFSACGTSTPAFSASATSPPLRRACRSACTRRPG